MDHSRFTDKAPGRLVKIGTGAASWAFVPDPMPRKWEIPRRLWPQLANAREAIGRLDGIGRHMPNHALLLRPLQQREALRSSSMEGTYATPVELLLYEAEPKEPKSSRDPVNAWREVFNYGRALDLGQRLLDTGYPLSLQLVRMLHAELLNGVRGGDKLPGDFRSSQVHIGVGARFVPPPAHYLPECLEAFEKDLNVTTNIDTLVRAFMAHYQFETIHPFNDGNGRVGRLLLSLQIYHAMNLSAPWLYMSPYFERYKDEYIDLLFRVSTHNDWESWIAFCIKGAETQANDAIRRFDGLVALQRQYHEKVEGRARAGRLHPIIDYMFEWPVITIPQLMKRLKVTYPTAKSDVGHLTDLGILKPGRVDVRPKYFYAQEIMKMIYDE